ncbi:aminopeptidase [Bacillus spongiae]|uniref:Aminopeptidase n=1 Tax=Bacillus spongiae TaxID=2683610 RepID=A0ABU8HD52_9BACI
MTKFEKKLEEYADLLIRVGINLQEGQKLFISAPISAATFARMLMEKAYSAGAKRVTIDYNDELASKMTLEMAPEEGLKDFPLWKARGFVEMAEENVAFLNIASPNPKLLNDVEPSRVATAMKAQDLANKDYLEYITSGKISWLIAAIPSVEWAKTVFPDVDDEKAVSLLWEQIFYTTRADQEQPVQLWKQHIDNLSKYADYLNNQNFSKLHYTGSGTDLTIELDSESFWMCAEFENDKGVSFIPNLPTEEVFTIPVKTGVNGVVSSSKPLNYSGNLIKDFTLTFKEGQVVDFTASEGYDTLKQLIEMDEGSRYLGEVALVPHDSPISNTNIIFNNTLFDENASCHLALGNALTMCVKDGKNKTKAQLEAMGFNESITHVDFMIGNGELSIEGVKQDGTMETIFHKGNWAIDINAVATNE